MEYLLSDGGKVNLYNNNDIAKFIFLAMPQLGVSFVGDVPHLVQTPQVKKIFELSQMFQLRRAASRQRRLEALVSGKVTESRDPDTLYDECFGEDFDDHIPF